MKLTLAEALQKGIEAHKAGKAQEADQYYTAILKAQPKHPDANHNMGVLAVGVGKAEAALPFFKTALEANSSIVQYWLSYIDTLIKLGRIDDAKAVCEQARSNGVKGDGFDKLEKQLSGQVSAKVEATKDPPQDQMQALINLFNNNECEKALIKANKLIFDFPNSNRLHNILGVLHHQLGDAEEAIKTFTKAISLMPDYAEAYNNMGNSLQIQGKIDKAIEAHNKALSIKPDYPEAYNNIGLALCSQGKLIEATKAYKKALTLKPDFPEPYWNLSGIAENIDEAKNWVEKCLEANPNHLKAKLTLSALKFYEGDKSDYNELMKM